MERRIANRKILVTGATGFIGWNLVKSLKEKGDAPVCQVRASSNTGKIEQLGLDMVEFDIRDKSGVEAVFERVCPDIVFHCAAKVKSDSEGELFGPNVAGTRNILEACMNSGVKRLVYLSSIAVINGNKVSPLLDSLPYKATAAYGRSKIEAEKIVLEYRDKGLPVVVIRPGMVFGEGEPHAMDKIFRMVKNGLVFLPPEGFVRDRLQLAYIDNVVSVIELAACKEEALQGTFIVVDKDVISVCGFLGIIAEEMGRPPLPVIPRGVLKLGLKVPLVKKNFYRIFKDRVYDISGITKKLCFQQPVGTEEGLRKTVKAWIGK